MTETKHTPGAVRAAKTIMNGHKLINTAYGRKTEEGITDLIERETGAEELLAALKGLFEHCAMVHKHSGEGSNQREADAAQKLARAAIDRAEAR